MPIPRLKYFIQCDEVRNDNNKFSAIGLFDTIFSFIFPASHKRFFLMLGFTGAEGQYDIELHIQAPNRQTLAQTKGMLQLGSADQVGNVVFAFENFPLPLEGAYTISVFLDGDYCAEHQFSARPPVGRRQRSQDEIAALLQQPDVIKSANADISCEKCRVVFRFQYQLDPSSPVEPGYLRLPPGDFFACGNCGHHISIEQIRKNLENIVGIPRQWLEPPGQPPQPGRQENRPDPEQGGGPSAV